ncbi:MAG: hypothetical protein KAX19_04950 [Candidatus Brocadiae bacterium]|nr:hypothetical protein [Candidatus Brocadiia bacterium]
MSRYGGVVLAVLAALVLFATAAAMDQRKGEGVARAKIEALLRRADELQEAGRVEDAAALREQAERLDRKMEPDEGEHANAEAKEKVGHLKRRIHTLMEMAHAAEEEDMADAAEAFRARAEDLEQELRGTLEGLEQEQRAGQEKVRDRLEDLRARAEELEEARRLDQAHALRQEVAELEAEMAERAGADDLKAVLHEMGRRQKELQNQIGELREYVHDLREQVEALRAEVGELREQLAAARE